MSGCNTGIDTTLCAEPLVLFNGAIHTMNPDQPHAQAIAIAEDGTISAIGSNNDVFATVSEDATTVNLMRAMVLPGFHDVHLHGVEAGINLKACYVEPDYSVPEIIATLRDCSKYQKNGRWVTAAGLNMVSLLDQTDRPIIALDKAFPDRPVYVLDDLGHGILVNSAALREVGLDRVEQNPPGAMMLRDQTGALNGVIFENGQQVFRDAANPPTKENEAKAYEDFLGSLQILAEHGITSVSDAGGYWRQAQTKSWEMAEERGTLTVRAANALYVYPDHDYDEQIEVFRQRLKISSEDLAGFTQAKIYVDGILSQATGLLKSPYENELTLAPQEELGFSYFSKDKLFDYARDLSAMGYQLNFHVTGDEAARLALEAIAQATRLEAPHRLTHLYLVDPADFEKFNEWNVVADFQLAPSSVDQENYWFMREVIGDRADDLLPAKPMLDAGITLTLSSDWDADTLNPLEKIQTVLTRPRGAIKDLNQVLAMMTINPAILLGHSNEVGSLETGKSADLAILQKDITKLAPQEIGGVPILATLLQGRIVYDRSGLFER